MPPCRPKTEKNFYSEAEERIIIEFAKNHKYGLGIIIMLKTGVRRGELLGLKWADVDFKDNLIHVQRAISDAYINGKVTIQIDEGNSLTKNHNRLIPFDYELKEVLLREKNENEYIITNSKGGLMQTSNYSHRIYVKFMKDFVAEHKDIKALNPHELRHTYGTLLKNRGVDIYIIQKLLGHSQISTTADIYIHDDIYSIKKALNIK